MVLLLILKRPNAAKILAQKMVGAMFNKTKLTSSLSAKPTRDLENPLFTGFRRESFLK